MLSCGEAGGGAGGGARARRYVGLYTGPYFDPSAPNNITAQLGTHAYLPCKVHSRCSQLDSGPLARQTGLMVVVRRCGS